jgi:Secretion system C-terminal sorting domain
MDADYAVMEMNNYHFQSIEFTGVEFKNGENLYVKNCEFSDVKINGILSENVRSLQVEDCQFTGFNIVNLPPNDGYERNMIHVINPKVGNSNLIQRNQFTTSGNLHCAYFNHVQLQVYGNSPNHEMKAQIVANTFNQFNNFNTQNDFFVGSSKGIYLCGNYSTSSDVDIENNEFVLDANNDGYYPNNTGVDVINGYKNNVHIVGNRLTSGLGWFCRMFGSNGVGNEFTQNTVDLGQNGRLANGIIWMNYFLNSKICSNIDYFATYSTYSFSGPNHNTNFTKNITYGAQYESLTFGFNNPLIGEQKHKGNEWFPYSCGINCYPYVRHYSPAIVDLSKFIVHTPQSDFNTNTGFYNYFSSFFPDGIDPDPISSGFWKIEPREPTADCITQGPNFNAFNERMIAQNGLKDYLRNPFQEYDAELYLYRALKSNPNAVNTDRVYNQFLERNIRRNKDKITDLEKIVDESDKISEETKNKIEDFKNQIKILESANRRFSRNTPPSIDEIKAWFKKRSELDENIRALYGQYNAEKKSKLQEAKRINDNIIPTAYNEKLIRDVYSIYLEGQLRNEGKFTSEQTKRLKAIAQTCVNDGGMIVFVARGFLSAADLYEIQNIIDACEPMLHSEPNQRLGIAVNKESQKMPTQITVFPNPANESFTIVLKDNTTAIAQIVDITGKKVREYNLQTGSNTIRHDLPRGMYIISVKMSDGKIISQKLSISY